MKKELKKVSGLVVFAMALAFALTGQQHKKYVPPDYEKKMQAIKDFESGVEPLFVLGDLNEDGAVDDKDLQLVKAYVEQKKSAGISCFAAGDVNTDDVVNAKDVSLLEATLKKGSVEAPPLVFHSSLPCDYKNFFIAARSGARPGGTVPVHFLDGRFNAQNSTVTVQSGEAKISRAKDAYLVQIAQTTKSGSLITVAITLANSRKYSYTFTVVPLR
jgi:Dockerin type I domain